MSYLNYLRQKLKYNSPLRLVHDGLERVGLSINPYYLELQEGVPDISGWGSGFDPYEVVTLGPEEMKTIAGLDGHHKSESTLLRWLEEGCICLGIKQGTELAAFTWSNLKVCDFPGHRFPLKEDEAYLFDTFTMSGFRGRRLAPYARYCMCRELARLNRTKLYSISHYLNTQALNFKRKLGVRPVEFRLQVCLFGKFSHSWPIRRYSTPAPALSR